MAIYYEYLIADIFFVLYLGIKWNKLYNRELLSNYFSATVVVPKPEQSRPCVSQVEYVFIYIRNLCMYGR
jgi:hypothetical protein